MKVAVVMVLLAFVMAIPVAVLGSAYNVPPTRVEDGEVYVALRPAAYAFDAAAHWDGQARAAMIVRADGEILIIRVEAIGGFIENGVSWVPYGYAQEVLVPFLMDVAPAGPVERIDLTLWEPERFADVREAMFATDLPPGAIAVGFIEYMSDNIGARSPFTYRELEAAVWIVEELLAMGHDWDNITVQEFTYWQVNEMGLGLLGPLNWNWVTSPGMLGEGRDYQLRPDRVSQNVVLILPGESERKIIVGAHYDSPPYPSASDNASGTALLLESAQRMLETEHYYTIVYVFFGSEEVGLLGAFYYIETLTPRQQNNIVMMVNADVIIEGPYLIYGAGAAPEMDDVFMADLLEAVMEAIIEPLIMQFEAIVAEIEAMGIEDMSTVLPFYTLEGWIEFRAAGLAASPVDLLLSASYLGLAEPMVTDVAAQVNAIAAELNAQHDFELISIPEAIAMSSDNLAFLFNGHTIVSFVGMERLENIDDALMDQLFAPADMWGGFTMTVLHTPLDEFHFIEATWPGMMNANLEAFVIFLEAILTGSFS